MREANFDGLVGPTHNYSGLAFGNEASQKNAHAVSHPRAALLQGLEKMRLLHALGLPQGLFPPQPRPDMRFLYRLGFKGQLRDVMDAVARRSPELLPVCYSSSGMWAANAATVTPSCDSADGRVHFTPANLHSTAHRALEPPFTSRMLQTLFPDAEMFAHHAPLPPGPLTSDEGAANHMRLRPRGQGGNMHVFVYGRSHDGNAPLPTRYPARQTLQASQSVARLHGLKDDAALFVRQHPQAIDAGVFHNDVISVGHEHLMLYHEHAFADGEALPAQLKKQFGADAWALVRVDAAALSLADTVSSYLFNSQLVSLDSGGMALIAPHECAEHPGTAAIIASWQEDDANPIAAVHFVDLKQSMQNGGGPACLRLRVPLNEPEWAKVHPGAVYTPALHEKLEAWANTHYRDQLKPDDLRDPALAEEALSALDALAGIMHLGNLYDD